MYQIVDKFADGIRPFIDVPTIGQDGKYHFIYCIINKMNGKFYIGKHSSRNERLEDGYFSSGKKYFQNALQKHGKENFEFIRVKFYPSSREAFDAEANLITMEMIKSPECYNEGPGGYGWGTGEDNVLTVRKQAGFVHHATLASREGRHWLSDPSRNRTCLLAKAGLHPFQNGKNPCVKGRKAWVATRASDRSKLAWSFAMEIYNKFSSEKIGNERLTRFLQELFDQDAPSTHTASIKQINNMLKYFRTGWIPDQDPEWLEWKKQFRNTDIT